jgi:hypothetical protein
MPLNLLIGEQATSVLLEIKKPIDDDERVK